MASFLNGIAPFSISQAAMSAARWFPATALGLHSDLAIAADTMLSRPDDEASVSTFSNSDAKKTWLRTARWQQLPPTPPRSLFGRSPVSTTPGRAVWIGSASYDERVGLSHTTGQITHHIAPDDDQERDHLLADLKQAGALQKEYTVDGFHITREGHNGSGDLWHTDGGLYVSLIELDIITLV